jgi:hypothetical protein
MSVIISRYISTIRAGHVMSNSNMDKYIDFDIIESYRKPITMPAKYLEVLSVVYKNFSSNRYDEIEEYIVNVVVSWIIRSMSVIISRYISTIRCWCIPRVVVLALVS